MVNVKVEGLFSLFYVLPSLFKAKTFSASKIKHNFFLISFIEKRSKLEIHGYTSSVEIILFLFRSSYFGRE